MTITAQIIADSISPEGIRLTTLQLRYPRFIHAEAKTHRVITIDGVQYEETIDMGFMDDADLSRNASSSRAIPVERLIEDIRRDPAMPVCWGGHQAGMQAAAELTGFELEAAKSAWLMAMNDAIGWAEVMVNTGLHKQIANRILEPWAHINVVVTATSWENFFTLRRHSDAQPEIKVLADTIWLAMNQSTPKNLQPGEWHLPYVGENDFSSARHVLKTGRITRDEPMYDELVDKILKKVSVARCARVSYLTHDGRVTTVQEDLALFERLMGAQPLHASPAEHQGTPDTPEWERDPHSGSRIELTGGWDHPELHGNLTGWIQYRKTFPNEYVEDARCKFTAS